MAAIVLVLGGIAYRFWGPNSNSQSHLPAQYVLSPSLDVLDTRAEVHRTIGILKSGDRVGVVQVAGDWTKVQLSDGTLGWVLGKELIDSGAYEKGQALLKQTLSEPVQATGHAAGPVNLHTEPSREAPVLGLLSQGQTLDVLNRRLVDKNSAANQAAQVAPPSSGGSAREAWYLVRSGPRAGWLLGRFVSLDPPPALAQYTEDYNTVAWLVLNTVADGGQKVPQYLVADRVGSQEFDFTHLRVFTWWVKRHHYVTAYVESNLRGEFPIRVEQIENTPYFRLRLTDPDGNKFQKVYKLSSTIVRPVGTLPGWESNAMPEPAPRKRRR